VCCEKFAKKSMDLGMFQSGGNALDLLEYIAFTDFPVLGSDFPCSIPIVTTPSIGRRF
jgi:hypothetical protein